MQQVNSVQQQLAAKLAKIKWPEEAVGSNLTLKDLFQREDVIGQLVDDSMTDAEFNEVREMVLGIVSEQSELSSWKVSKAESKETTSGMQAVVFTDAENNAILAYSGDKTKSGEQQYSDAVSFFNSLEGSNYKSLVLTGQGVGGDLAETANQLGNEAVRNLVTSTTSWEGERFQTEETKQLLQKIQGLLQELQQQVENSELSEVGQSDISYAQDGSEMSLSSQESEHAEEVASSESQDEHTSEIDDSKSQAEYTTRASSIEPQEETTAQATTQEASNDSSTRRDSQVVPNDTSERTDSQVTSNDAGTGATTQEGANSSGAREPAQEVANSSDTGATTQEVANSSGTGVGAATQEATNTSSTSSQETAGQTSSNNNAQESTNATTATTTMSLNTPHIKELEVQSIRYAQEAASNKEKRDQILREIENNPGLPVNQKEALIKQAERYNNEYIEALKGQSQTHAQITGYKRSYTQDYADLNADPNTMQRISKVYSDAQANQDRIQAELRNTTTDISKVSSPERQAQIDGTIDQLEYYNGKKFDDKTRKEWEEEIRKDPNLLLPTQDIDRNMSEEQVEAEMEKTYEAYNKADKIPIAEYGDFKDFLRNNSNYTLVTFKHMEDNERYRCIGQQDQTGNWSVMQELQHEHPTPTGQNFKEYYADYSAEEAAIAAQGNKYNNEATQSLKDNTMNFEEMQDFTHRPWYTPPTTTIPKPNTEVKSAYAETLKDTNKSTEELEKIKYSNLSQIERYKQQIAALDTGDGRNAQQIAQIQANIEKNQQIVETINPKLENRYVAENEKLKQKIVSKEAELKAKTANATYMSEDIGKLENEIEALKKQYNTNDSNLHSAGMNQHRADDAATVTKYGGKTYKEDTVSTIEKNQKEQRQTESLERQSKSLDGELAARTKGATYISADMAAKIQKSEDVDKKKNGTDDKNSTEKHTKSTQYAETIKKNQAEAKKKQENSSQDKETPGSGKPTPTKPTRTKKPDKAMEI